MPIVHFLNVNNGDCSIIQHGSGRNTVVDVCNAQTPTLVNLVNDAQLQAGAALEKGVNGNFNQKKYPVNPIAYMHDRGIKDVFRFILTHPDMDHMDGIKAFFVAFSPANFWDTDNNCEKEWGTANNGGFSEGDWKFYKKLRDAKPQQNPKRLTLYAGMCNSYWNRDENGNIGGDGIQILAPTPELVAEGNKCSDYNDSSYVLLYRANNNRILFAGDSHDKTWEFILKNYKQDVSDIDVLIAPHHGRHSDRDWKFLDVLRPTLTLFGNAPAGDLAYPAWKNRNLWVVTNNQGGNVILDASVNPLYVHVTGKPYAQAVNPQTVFNETHKAYYLGQLKAKQKAVAV